MDKDTLISCKAHPFLSKRAFAPCPMLLHELLAVHPDAPEQAMLHIHSLSGSTFDPDCVEALHRKLPAALAVLTQFPR
jgi:hypothetical protein